MKKYFFKLCAAYALVAVLTTGNRAAASILIDHTSTDLSKIPDQWTSQIKIFTPVKTGVQIKFYALAINSRNRLNKYEESCGPGEASG